MKDAAHWAHVRILMCNSDLEDLIVQVQRDALTAARELAHRSFDNLVFDLPAVDEALWSFDANLDLLMPPSAAEGGK